MNVNEPDDLTDSDAAEDPAVDAVDPGAAGVEHLQRAAREMVAAARSFLDAIEKVVEDRDALKEVSATVTGLAATVGETLGEAVRGRPAPWADAAWEPTPERDAGGARDANPADEPAAGPEGAAGSEGADGLDDAAGAEVTGETDDTEDWARPLVDPAAPRRPSRVRRISVE